MKNMPIKLLSISAFCEEGAFPVGPFLWSSATTLKVIWWHIGVAGNNVLSIFFTLAPILFLLPHIYRTGENIIQGLVIPLTNQWEPRTLTPSGVCQKCFNLLRFSGCF